MGVLKAKVGGTWVPVQYGVTYADDAETIAGVLTDKAVTPASLAAALGLGTTLIEPAPANQLTAGETSFDRYFVVTGSAAFTSQTVHFTYFTATRTETINTLAVITAGTPAAGITLIRYCVYEVAGNGDLTLVASTPNDTALLIAANTRYPKALSAPWAKTMGTRYAVGLLVVATTVPTLLQAGTGAAGTYDAIYGLAPRLSGCRTGQTDLPASITAANVAITRRVPYVEMQP